MPTKISDGEISRRGVCQECGEIREKGPTGMVCPNGHGKILPPLTRGQVNRLKYMKWAEQFPQAVKVKGRKFKIDGKEGLWLVTSVAVTHGGYPSYTVKQGTEIPHNAIRAKNPKGRVRAYMKCKE